MSGRAFIIIILLVAGIFLATGWFRVERATLQRLPEPYLSSNVPQKEWSSSLESARADLGKNPTPSQTSPAKSSFHDLSAITKAELRSFCLPLSSARTSTKQNFERGHFGKFIDKHGVERVYNPGSVLIKFQGDVEPSLLHVAEGTEVTALAQLEGRNDLAYAELDALMTRQFMANDEHLAQQWHHNLIGSSNAWSLRTDAAAIRIAIVDTPFQMNHPDLAGNTAAGWDIVNQREIASDTKGYFHSTIGAGMAAAVVNNSSGVAGAINAKILPVNINGYLSEMNHAINWCAENQVRVVNLSWDGAYSSTLNDAAANLRAKIDGMVIMSGVNSRRFLDYPNQPYITAVSMTDSSDLSKSAYGRHIDFAAPGWNIFSTTVNDAYESDSGSSYSAPLISGMIAAVMSINPNLTCQEIEEILKISAKDLGPSEWDQYYGWGRIDFGKAALYAATFMKVQASEDELKFILPYYPGIAYQFLRTSSLNEPWEAFTPQSRNQTDDSITLKENRAQENVFFKVFGTYKE